MATRRSHKLVAAVTVLVSVLLCGAASLVAAGPAAAAPKPISIVSPDDRAAVKGAVRYAVKTRSRRHVAFFVDGKRHAVRRARSRKGVRRGWLRGSVRFDTSSLRRGRHRLVVVQRDSAGRLRRDASIVFVRAPRPKSKPKLEPAQQQPPVPTAAGVTPTWRATFEGPTLSEWSWTDRDDGGAFFAASAAAEGVPPLGGASVGHFEVTQANRAADTLHSKVYKNWAVAGDELEWEDDAGRTLERLPGGSPAGTYAAWYYLPPDYRASNDWANIFQFKESYVDSDGDWQQDPQWWVNITPAHGWDSHEQPAGASGDMPVLAVSNWDGNTEEPRALLPAPRGRWFEIRADLHPGQRIDWYVDGRFWQSSSAARYPVGVSKPGATGWVFGVGHYGGLGKLWIDDASFSAR